MGDSKELKPKSFRIDDATADKFKEISSQIGGNQQETLAKLIEAYEFQGGKAILTDKKLILSNLSDTLRLLSGCIWEAWKITRISQQQSGQN